MRLVIRGRELPGASHCGHGRIGVALQVRTDPVGVVAGDPADARWETDVAVVGDDFRGPAVHGRRGERFVYLTWGDLSDGEFAMFRRAKLMLRSSTRPWSTRRTSTGAASWPTSYSP